MKIFFYALAAMLSAAVSPPAPAAPAPQTTATVALTTRTLAVYIWPCYHPDPFHQSKLGPGWTEWDLLKQAKPITKKHYQPRVPLWGYRDESDPKEMARSIDAMADAGIDAVIYDWYRYDDAINNGEMLEAALRKGFLGAPNNARLKFALMWANHEYINLFPFPPGVNFGSPNREVWRKGTVSRAAFDRHTADAIRDYFSRPNYWKIDGKPFFSIYDLDTLVTGLGGLEPAKQAFDDFRARVRAAGFPGLHLNLSYFNCNKAFAKFKGQSLGGRRIDSLNDLVLVLGIDSTNPYVWVHLVAPLEYSGWMDQAMQRWDQITASLQIPCFPNVSVGWDGTPRNYKGSYVMGSTPERFAEALRRARAWLAAHPRERGILTINAWNEWTEGSYLEPDTVHGTGYLDAIREVFGR